MKVIKKGREQAGWAREYECTGHGNRDGGCGAVLLVEEDDVYMTTNSSYDGSTDYYYTFQCCECGVETDIKASHLPTRVKNKARSNKRRPYDEETDDIR